jgi:hypothetical protein
MPLIAKPSKSCISVTLAVAARWLTWYAERDADLCGGKEVFAQKLNVARHHLVWCQDHDPVAGNSA